MQTGQAVLVAAGGAWDASLNHYAAKDGEMVTTQQVDEDVYVVGQQGFDVMRHTLLAWTDSEAQDLPHRLEANDAASAWDILSHLREGCLVWQCGGCDAWIFTSNRPRIGVLRCSTCGTGGVDFRHADRHVS